MITLRPCVISDFDLLLDLANQAVPFAPVENSQWLAARKAFDESRAVRRHYLAYDLNDSSAVGYGSLEQQGKTVNALRIYVVCRPDRLAREVGEQLLGQLLGDAAALGASQLWARELVEDEPIGEFFLQHGFKVTRQITIPHYRPMVLFERSLREPA